MYLGDREPVAPGLDPLLPRREKGSEIKEKGELSDELDDIVSAWRAGNLKVLDELLLAGMQEQREVYQSILVERNQRWAARIKDLLGQDTDYLIIVGALHLIGDDSVQVMLLDKGIETQQVR